MFLIPEIFPNAELSASERSMSEEDYENIVREVFDFYPKLVSFHSKNYGQVSFIKIFLTADNCHLVVYFNQFFLVKGNGYDKY